ncbi:MAG: class I SAM-dependent methyltransferase [bacterium]
MELNAEPLPEELEREAREFDEKIRERVHHGHIPDLRRMQPCDWFRNNVWRRPYLVNQMYSRWVQFCLDYLPPPGEHVLEVGCGPGYLSLELARYGYHMVGLDISVAALEIAEQLVKENPFKESFGSICHVRDDFTRWRPSDGGLFDAAVFCVSLHHFPDPAGVLDHVLTMLSPDGRIVLCEPSRDWWTRNDGAVMALLRAVLAAAGHWYEEIPVPATQSEIEALVDECFDEVTEATPKDQPRQSEMDNSCYGTEILRALEERFDRIAYQPDTVLYSRIAPGARFDSEEQHKRFTQFLHTFELYAIETKLLNPGIFMFAGERRKA